MFIFMGVQLVRKPVAALGASDSKLTRPGMWAGFVAGLLVILSNPKAILFYMGALPSFFDFCIITAWDILAICSISLVVPLVGNVMLAVMVDRMRRFLASPEAVRRLNVSSGVVLIGVGLLIGAT